MKDVMGGLVKTNMGGHEDGKALVVAVVQLWGV